MPRGMNLQGRQVAPGRWEGGIEWTRLRLQDGTVLPGYTYNPIKGCRHGCAWTMPDGQVAACYAQGVAEGVAAAAYPRGFTAHYWDPTILESPLRLTQRAGIFIDSMSDFWGHWVPHQERAQVLAMVRRAGELHRHIFFSLTKAAPQMLTVAPSDIPTNLWPGASSPPDTFMGQALDRVQQEKYMARALQSLRALAPTHTTWMSFEPYSQDYADLVAGYPGALRWAVVGAASNGATYYDPDEADVRALLAVLDQQGVPVFFKGNLRRAAQRWGLAWREAFPAVV